MKKPALAVFVVLLATVLASSCTTTKNFQVQIDSIGTNVYEAEKTYIVVPTDQQVKPDDLRFREYAGYLQKILAEKGYREVASSEEANIIVYMTYGVGDPETHTYAYSMPIYGQIGVTVTPGHPAPQPSPGTPPSRPPFPHYSPIYGIVGSKTEYQNYTTYFRYCKIEAFDLKSLRENNQERQLWSTIITSRGSSDDLRYAMPYMLAAAKDYIGVNTGTKIEVTINEKDPKVTMLK
jgi:predicted small secreted protein